MSGSNVDFQTPLSPTALLERLKTVDGAGSGLDADQTDGLHAFEIGGGGGINPRQEVRTVDGLGNIQSLSATPLNAASVWISVNGLVAVQGVDYLLSGTSLTWINTAYSLDPADTVLARYFV